MLDWLKWYSVPEGIRYGIYGIVVLVTLWIIWRSIRTSDSILDVVVVSLLATFAITPYALQYDFAPLVIVLFWALAVSSNAKGKWIPILLVIFITSVLIWERPISDGYWIILGLIGLTVWAKRAARKSAAVEPALSHSQ